MKGFLIYPATTPKTNNAFSWFRSAAAHHGIRLEVFFYDRSGITDELLRQGLPDFVLMRGYNTELSLWYEARGVRVINTTASMLLCRDKLSAGRTLEACGIPVPHTLSAEASGSVPGYPEIAEALRDGTFILKQRFGSKGENVYLIENATRYEAALEQCRATLEARLSRMGKDAEVGIGEREIRTGCEPIFQQYVSSSRGRDIRVWVFAGKVIGHVLRYNDRSFKSNFAQGGSYMQIPLPEDGARMAVSAAGALGLEFAGVDLLFDGEGGFLVCEVNGNPGFRTASTDIPELIFENFR